MPPNASFHGFVWRHWSNELCARGSYEPEFQVFGVLNPTLLSFSGLTCDYEYIDIRMQDEDGNSMRLFVDMDFKSPFELARSTPTYKELTDTLPHIFVGTEDKLNKMISLLCPAAKQSLRERGLHIPPWRTTTYMQSKWLSGCHHVPAENKEAKGGAYDYSKWTPSPQRGKPKRRNLGGGSGLSGQFSEDEHKLLLKLLLVSSSFGRDAASILFPFSVLLLKYLVTFCT